MYTIIDQLVGVTNPYDKIHILLSSFFGVFLGETGDLFNDLTRYFLSSIWFLLAFFLSYRYRKEPREKLLCYGFGLCLLQSVLMQVAVLTRIWYLDCTNIQNLVLPVVVPIRHCLYYLGSSCIALAFGCYTGLMEAKSIICTKKYNYVVT